MRKERKCICCGKIFTTQSRPHGAFRGDVILKADRGENCLTCSAKCTKIMADFRDRLPKDYMFFKNIEFKALNRPYLYYKNKLGANLV